MATVAKTMAARLNDVGRPRNGGVGFGVQRLKGVGLRPTRQRLALAELIFGSGNCHVTAEQLHSQALNADVSVSLATVYNTLHQFTQAGLMREVVVDSGRSYFDTNISDHHHFFEIDTGNLIDIAADEIGPVALPEVPDGRRIERVDVIVRVRSSGR